MITSFFIYLLSIVLYSLTFFLPTGDTLSANFQSSFSWLVTQSFQWDYIFPIATIWIQFAIVVPVLVAYFAWNGVQWLISFIRGN